MSKREAASGQHEAVDAGSTGRVRRNPVKRGGRGSSVTFSADLYCEPDPHDYENYVSPKELVNTPRWVRARIRDAIRHTHALINSRLLNATRPADVATEQGMADEIAAMVRAIRQGTPSDVRCSRIALAATLILLAERDDRPAK